ncbi:hypothetical protein FHX80_114722 [Streptomyces brevispora]|uniref:Uncharacterized protein n=1 Tax=Streptomyces brevispora TaxID=887462 RepID=A0A561V3Q2_9ACTN|nr:hypothetical protein FHX80_114722 [Streptomyces brevispora]
MVGRHGVRTESGGPPIRYDAVKRSLNAPAERAFADGRPSLCHGSAALRPGAGGGATAASPPGEHAQRHPPGRRTTQGPIRSPISPTASRCCSARCAVVAVDRRPLHALLTRPRRAGEAGTGGSVTNSVSSRFHSRSRSTTFSGLAGLSATGTRGTLFDHAILSKCTSTDSGQLKLNRQRQAPADSTLRNHSKATVSGSNQDRASFVRPRRRARPHRQITSVIRASRVPKTARPTRHCSTEPQVRRMHQP